MSEAINSYSGYNYVLSFLDAFGIESPAGGFAEASGLLTFSKQKHADKITGVSKVPDVTLKRGVIGDTSSLWSWINQVRNGAGASRRNGIITLRNLSNNPVQSWKIYKAKPVRYTGPPLGGKGGQVAIEELVLAAEGIEIVPPRRK